MGAGLPADHSLTHAQKRSSFFFFIKYGQGRSIMIRETDTPGHPRGLRRLHSQRCMPREAAATRVAAECMQRVRDSEQNCGCQFASTPQPSAPLKPLFNTPCLFPHQQTAVPCGIPATLNTYKHHKPCGLEGMGGVM